MMDMERSVASSPAPVRGTIRGRGRARGRGGKSRGVGGGRGGAKPPPPTTARSSVVVKKQQPVKTRNGVRRGRAKMYDTSRIQAAYERCRDLKAAYNEIATAAKNALQDLADRDVEKMMQDHEYYKSVPAYHEVTGGLARIRDDKTRTTDARRTLSDTAEKHFYEATVDCTHKAFKNNVEDALDRFYDAQLRRLDILENLSDNKLPLDLCDNNYTYKLVSDAEFDLGNGCPPEDRVDGMLVPCPLKVPGTAEYKKRQKKLAAATAAAAAAAQQGKPKQRKGIKRKADDDADGTPPPKRAAAAVAAAATVTNPNPNEEEDVDDDNEATATVVSAPLHSRGLLAAQPDIEGSNPSSPEADDRPDVANEDDVTKHTLPLPRGAGEPDQHGFRLVQKEPAAGREPNNFIMAPPMFQFDDLDIGFRDSSNDSTRRATKKNRGAYLDTPNAPSFHYPPVVCNYDCRTYHKDDLDQELVRRHNLHPKYGLFKADSTNEPEPPKPLCTDPKPVCFITPSGRTALATRSHQPLEMAQHKRDREIRAHLRLDKALEQAGATADAIAPSAEEIDQIRRRSLGIEDRMKNAARALALKDAASFAETGKEPNKEDDVVSDPPSVESEGAAAAEAPEGIPETVFEVDSEVVTEVISEVVLEMAPEGIPELVTEVISEVVLEMAPEMAPEAALEVAPEVAPEAVAEVEMTASRAAASSMAALETPLEAEPEPTLEDTHMNDLAVAATFMMEVENAQRQEEAEGFRNAHASFRYDAIRDVFTNASPPALTGRGSNAGLSLLSQLAGFQTRTEAVEEEAHLLLNHTARLFQLPAPPSPSPTPAPAFAMDPAPSRASTPVINDVNGNGINGINGITPQQPNMENATQEAVNPAAAVAAAAAAAASALNAASPAREFREFRASLSSRQPASQEQPTPAPAPQTTSAPSSSAPTPVSALTLALASTLASVTEQSQQLAYQPLAASESPPISAMYQQVHDEHQQSQPTKSQEQMHKLTHEPVAFNKAPVYTYAHHQNYHQNHHNQYNQASSHHSPLATTLPAAYHGEAPQHYDTEAVRHASPLTYNGRLTNHQTGPSPPPPPSSTPYTAALYRQPTPVSTLVSRPAYMANNQAATELLPPLRPTRRSTTEEPSPPTPPTGGGPSSWSSSTTQSGVNGYIYGATPQPRPQRTFSSHQQQQHSSEVVHDAHTTPTPSKHLASQPAQAPQPALHNHSMWSQTYVNPVPVPTFAQNPDPGHANPGHNLNTVNHNNGHMHYQPHNNQAPLYGQYHQAPAATADGPPSKSYQHTSSSPVPPPVPPPASTPVPAPVSTSAFETKYPRLAPAPLAPHKQITPAATLQTVQYKPKNPAAAPHHSSGPVKVRGWNVNSVRIKNRQNSSQDKDKGGGGTDDEAK